MGHTIIQDEFDHANEILRSWRCFAIDYSN